ncbi:unnamed protein product [Urochloa humidicola]
MAAWPNPALPLLLVAALLAFEDWLSTPSCSGGPPAARGPGELRAMMVADCQAPSESDKESRKNRKGKNKNNNNRDRIHLTMYLDYPRTSGFSTRESPWRRKCFYYYSTRKTRFL